MTDQTRPDTLEKWEAACAAQFVARGIESADAREYAESLAEFESFCNGINVAEWGSAKDAANDEMSYWAD